MRTITKTELKPTEMGMLPRDWGFVRLGDVCPKIGSGITPRGAEKVYKETGTVLIRSQNVYNNSFNVEGLVYIDEATANDMENVAVKKEDVLLNITGDSVARCCTVPEEILPARVNQHVSIIRTDGERLNPLFLRYYLTSPRMQAFMLSLARSGGTRNALTKGTIERFLIPEPSLEEQTAIANVLSAIDFKINLNRQMNNTLEAIGKAVFKHWFIDFEFPNEEGRPYGSSGGETSYSIELDKEIPKEWEVRPFSDVIEVNPKRELRAGTMAKKISMSNLGRWQACVENWSYDEYKSGSKFMNGDTLFARITPSLENGKTAFVSTLNDDEIGFGSTEFIVLGTKVIGSKLYIFHLSRSNEIRSAAINAMTGTSGRQRVPNELFDNLPIGVPSVKVLGEFEKVCSALFDHISCNARETKTLSEIRDSLLPRLMSGKIRVPVEVR